MALDNESWMLVRAKTRSDAVQWAVKHIAAELVVALEKSGALDGVKKKAYDKGFRDGEESEWRKEQELKSWDNHVEQCS
ncbi:MAG: hypothetical protein K0U84_15175 [Actinomycetia bacterium]|nr:hypothetical protein [Actinomycetes bacterium]